MGSLRRHFRNWISWAGMVLAASALFSFLLLFAIDLFAARRSPYVGILAYVVAPAFFIMGLLLTMVGVLLQARKERKALRIAKPLRITIDFSRRRDRRILVAFALGTVALLFLSALGSYQTYQVSESVEFCGKACHLPMEPEFVASQHTAHA